MTDLLPHPVADRRQPRISHEELRKHLIAADEERYVLRIELDAARAAASGRRWRSWTPSRRRAAVGIATVIMTGLAGGLAWQMCPSSAGADDRSSVRVETRTVTPRIVADLPAAPPPALAPANTGAPVAARTRAHRQVQRPTVERRFISTPQRSEPRVPRPLSPGEFGRKTLG